MEIKIPRMNEPEILTINVPAIFSMPKYSVNLSMLYLVKAPLAQPIAINK